MSAPESETLNSDLAAATISEPLLGEPPQTHARLLQQAESALSAVERALREPKLSKFHWSELSRESPTDRVPVLEETQATGRSMKIVLGRTSVPFEEFRRWQVGNVVVLDKLVQEPVEILVDDRLVARGEVLVLNQKFCVRVTEVLVSTRPTFER